MAGTKVTFRSKQLSYIWSAALIQVLFLKINLNHSIQFKSISLQEKKDGYKASV